MESNIKYIEVEFAHGKREDYTPDTIDTEDSITSICILAKREGTLEELEQFCKTDIHELGYDFIWSATVIPKEEAHLYFDMADENNLPVFE